MQKYAAALLARFSRHPRPSCGSPVRHPLARVAWRTLTAAAGRGDQTAIETVWRVWLRGPDDETWERLCRWRGAEVVTEAVLGAAVGYLAAELTRRRDWPGLWRLSLGFPLAEASTAVRRLPPGWRPADEAGQQLLARLAAAGPPELTAAAAAPPATHVTAGGSGPTWRP